MLKDINLVIFYGFIIGSTFMGSLAATVFDWKPSVEWATFTGPFLGSIIGLLSIIIGALWNAEENRKRDDRLRSIEKRTFANAFLLK
jgi:hypothetical protein